MQHTKIEWVKNPDGSQGYTWNPITGCLNGCSYCYARKLANGRLFSRYMANTNYVSPRLAKVDAINVLDPFYPRFWQSRLNEPLYGNPKGIFVCDMGELFGDWLPRDWQDRIFAIIKGNPQHRFYLLTKQPQNLIKFTFPDNCWVGVTATTYDMFWRALHYLEQIEAKTKYISCEPLLEDTVAHLYQIQGIIDWVIIGGQSGPHKFYPLESWIQEIEDAADKAGIPVFEKDNLRKVWARPPRQEMPK